MNSKGKTTNVVDGAARCIAESLDYSDELRNLVIHAHTRHWCGNNTWRDS
jgi:hypothetical protein